MSSKQVLKLFLRRNDYRGNLIFSLLNYNKVDFDLFVEHFLSGMRVVKDHYPQVKELPLLRVERDKKVFHYEGEQRILEEMKKMRMLKVGITHSAWETQTCAWLEASVIPCFETMTHTFPWYLSESFINSGVLNARTGDYFSGLIVVLKDALSLQLEHRKYWLKSASGARTQFLQALTEWEERLGSRNFHGDTTPDKADFLMFSLLGCYQMRLKPLLSDYIRTQLWRDRLTKLIEPQQG